MTTVPFVELTFHPTDLRPGDLPRAGAYLGTPSQALEAALAVTRAAMVNKMKEEVSGLSAPTHNQLLRIADLAWQAGFWNFRKVSAPIMADAYRHAYQAANAGDVPDSVLYSLADQHAEKIGEYFHTTSRDALSEGFNTLVNRRVPAKAAADTVLEAYGLAPRQMRAYTSASQFRTPIANVIPMPIKRKAKAYIDKAFIGRAKKLSAQEEHNIDEQAKQFAWMWLQDKGRLSYKAQKLWITASDEKVCPVCGPLHGQRVAINERFKTKQGEFWTPGLHPNCRCVVRLIENRFSKDLHGTELQHFNQLHPRAQDGRFGTKTRTRTIDVDREFNAIIAQPHTATARRDPELARMFQEVVSVIPPTAAGVSRQFSARPAAAATQPKARPQAATARPQAATARPKAATAAPRAVPVTVSAVETKAEAKAAPAPAKPKTVPATKTGTLAPVKTDHVWGVFTPNEYSDPANPRSFRLNTSVRFTGSEQAAAAKASEYIADEVDNQVERIMRGGGMIYDEREDVYYRLTQRQVRSIVESYARSAPFLTALNPNPANESFAVPDELYLARQTDEMGNTLKDAEGRPIREAIQTREYARAWGLSHFNFDVQIGRVKLEDAQRVSTTTERKGQEWGFEGDFRARGMGRFTRDQDFTAGIVDLAPVHYMTPAQMEAAKQREAAKRASKKKPD